MQRFPKLDKIMLPPPFKFVLIVKILIFPPFKDPKVWEMQRFNFEKKHSPPQLLFSLVLCSGYQC